MEPLVENDTFDATGDLAESSGGAEAEARTQRSDIFLGPITAQDARPLFEWINDRDLVILNSPFRPVTEAGHAAWFDEVQRRPDTVILAIRLAPENQLIGTLQLHNIHPIHRSAELQIRIANPEHRGKGHGRRAISLALRLAFEDLNLNRVSLHVLSTNARAIRTYLQAGFVDEGVLRDAAFIAGSYVDVRMMGILRREYG